jgi:NAD(P)-dependent dehydrogenase (short-subunit alcohol dehydrogenase family)
MGFKDKTALITGSARNIGLAIARDLAARGVSVAIADICRNLETVPYPLSSSDDLEKSAAELASLGVQAIGLTCDVRDENQVSQAVKRVIAEFGKLDILVNNAGVVSLFSTG